MLYINFRLHNWHLFSNFFMTIIFSFRLLYTFLMNSSMSNVEAFFFAVSFLLCELDLSWLDLPAIEVRIFCLSYCWHFLLHPSSRLIHWCHHHIILVYQASSFYLDQWTLKTLALCLDPPSLASIQKLNDLLLKTHGICYCNLVGLFLCDPVIKLIVACSYMIYGHVEVLRFVYIELKLPRERCTTTHKQLLA